MKPMICDSCNSCLKEIRDYYRPLYASSYTTVRVIELLYFCKVKDVFIRDYKTSCNKFSNSTLDNFKE